MEKSKKEKIKMCLLCKKNEAKDEFFCEECLSKENRDLTFWPRLRIFLKAEKDKIGLPSGRHKINNGK